MAVARRGEGVRATVAALTSQVHPVFMLPPLAVSLFGGVLTGTLAPLPAGLHLVAIFAAVYTAHVRDGYVDFYQRGEDESAALTPVGCRLATLGAAILFLVAIAGLWWVTAPIVVALTVPTWLIGALHAPYLDTSPLGATAGYPVGVALALLGGYAAQAHAIRLVPIAYTSVFLLLLLGVKIIDDSTDVAFDRTIGKRTVAVVLGPRRARTVAYGLMAGAMGLTIGGVAWGLMPVGSLLGVVAFSIVGGVAVAADSATATMLLVRGAYVFLAALLAAAWYRPFG